MITPEVSNYIQAQRATGVSDGAIIQALQQSGWSAQEAINALQEASLPAVPIVPAKSSHKWRWLLVTSFVVILLAGAGGASAYFFYWQAPAKVLDRSATAMKALQSVDYSASITTSGIKSDASQTTPTERILQITANGSIDKTDPSNPKTHTTILGKETSDPTDTGTGLEFITIGQVLYAQISALSDDVPVYIQAYKNQWIEIDREAIRKDLLDYLPASLKSKVADSGLENSAKDTAKLEQLKALVSSTKLMSGIEKLATVEIDGQSMYHYQFTIDKVALEQFVIDASAILDEKGMSDQSKTRLHEELQQLGDLKPEVFIGKKDHYIHRINATTTLTDVKDSTAVINIQLELNLTNFNQATAINAPEHTHSLQELIADMLGSAFSKPAATTAVTSPATSTIDESDEPSIPLVIPGVDISDIKIDPTPADRELQDQDGDGLDDELETGTYKTDPNNADTDGDGYNDSAELQNGYDPLGPGKLGE